MSAVAPPGAVPLSSISAGDLQRLRQKLDQEIKVLGRHVVELRGAQRRFEESKKAAASLTPENEGKDILVPLTSSVYVPATLIDTKTVLVDIGTGYHAQKTIKQAGVYCEGRSKEVGESCSLALKAIAEKNRFMEAVTASLAQQGGVAK